MKQGRPGLPRPALAHSAVLRMPYFMSAIDS